MIELYNYNIERDIQENDSNLCESIVSEYKGSNEQISELFHSVADSFTEIYNSNLFEIGFDLYAGGHCEEATENLKGSDDIDIINILQTAHYYYNKEVLRSNIENIIFNYIANIVNEKKLALVESDIEEIIEDNDLNEDWTFSEIDSILEDVEYELKINSLKEFGYKYCQSKNLDFVITKEEIEELVDDNSLEEEKEVIEAIDELIEEKREELEDE